MPESFRETFHRTVMQALNDVELFGTMSSWIMAHRKIYQNLFDLMREAKRRTVLVFDNWRWSELEFTLAKEFSQNR